MDRPSIRKKHPTMYRKEPCNKGPENGFKDPNQLLIMADYEGRVMQLDMVDGIDCFTLIALKSRVWDNKITV